MIAAIRDVAATGGPQSIVIVTGGADSCNPEAGQLIRQEAERAGVEMRVFVVGFQVPPDEAEAVRALVAMIPGATYKEAAEPSALRSALTEIQTEINRQAAGTTKTTPTAPAHAVTACDHPYMPLRTGASWTYATTQTTMAWSVTSASGSTDSAAATMEITMPSGSMTVHWTCGSQGIVSYDFGSLSAPSFGQVATIEVINSSGTFLPPADRLAPGSSWPNNHTVVMHVSEQGFTMDITSETSETLTVTGMETITVPAGTFEALRVDGTETVSASGGMVAVPSYTMSTSHWYAKGVGIVRYSYTGKQTQVVADLTAYSVP
jgi:hypothetical protein